MYTVIPIAAPEEENNGFIYAKVFGGFEKVRSSVCFDVTLKHPIGYTLFLSCF